MAEASLSAEQVEARYDVARADVDAVARVLMAEWERVEGKPVNVSYVATFADMARALLASPYLAAMLSAAEDAARAEGVQEGGAEVAAAVEALHTRRDVNIYDDEECAEQCCGHPEGTCVIVTPSVCGHCADQTEPNGAWEHLIRPAAYWPCATIRALADSSAPDAYAAHDAAGGDEGV